MLAHPTAAYCAIIKGKTMRGCEKRVIYMKNTGSDCFEEAYFVVKDKECVKDRDEILKEANRIIRENIYTGRGAGRKIRSHLTDFVIFASGFLISFLLSLLIFLARG